MPARAHLLNRSSFSTDMWRPPQRRHIGNGVARSQHGCKRLWGESGGWVRLKVVFWRMETPLISCFDFGERRYKRDALNICAIHNGFTKITGLWSVVLPLRAALVGFDKTCYVVRNMGPTPKSHAWSPRDGHYRAREGTAGGFDRRRGQGVNSFADGASGVLRCDPHRRGRA